MSMSLDKYLGRVMAVAGIADLARRQSVRDELEDHLLQKIEDLEKKGMIREDAVYQAIEDNGNPVIVGYKLRDWSFIDVRVKGTARGFIAIGPKAKGVIAIGGLAFGIIACGGLACGLFSFGGLALGLLLATGGCAAGGFSYGGLSIGLVAFGGASIGIIASGGTAIGLWVPGGGICLRYFTPQNVPKFLRIFDHMLSFNANSPQAARRFFSGTLIFNFLLWLPFFLLMILQGVMMFREHKRIRKISPADVY